MPVTLLTLREESSYGYELMERLQEFGLFEETNPGTMYRALRQMEKEGLCYSEWETAKRGPARRMYFITEAGEEYLDAWAKGCEQYRQVMDAFSEAYKGRMPRSSEKNGW